MTIENTKNYKVEKYTKKMVSDLGTLTGEDAKRILKGYEYDELLGLWFSPRGKVAYFIEVV